MFDYTLSSARSCKYVLVLDLAVKFRVKISFSSIVTTVLAITPSPRMAEGVPGKLSMLGLEEN